MLKKTIIINLVIVSLLPAFITARAVQGEFFQTRSKSPGVFDLAGDKILYGLFVTDIVLSKNFNSIHDKLLNLENHLQSRGYVSGRDYYHGKDYFFFLPDKKRDDWDTNDKIYDIYFTLLDGGEKVVMKDNPSGHDYVRKIAAGNKYGAAAPVFDIPDASLVDELGRYVELRSFVKLKSDLKNELVWQRDNFIKNRKEYIELVKTYGTFDKFFKSMKELTDRIASEGKNPDRASRGIDQIVSKIYDIPVIVIEPYAELGKRPDKQLDFEKLNSITGSVKKDYSTRMLRHLLFMVNLIIINRNEFPNIGKLCKNPYKELDVFKVSDFISKKVNSKILYSYKLNLLPLLQYGGMYSVTLFNMKGEFQMIHFNDYSPVADFNTLREFEKRINAEIAVLDKEIVEANESAGAHPLNEKYAKVPYEKLEGEYRLLSYLSANRQSCSFDATFCINLAMNHEESLKRYGLWRDNKETDDLLKMLRKSSRGIPGYKGIFHSDGSWYIMGYATGKKGKKNH